MYTYLSAYALDRFEQCPRKFALSALEELYWPAPGGDASKAELGTRFHQWVAWRTCGFEPVVPEDLGSLVTNFIGSKWANPPGTVLTEWDFYIAVAGLSLRGRFDRLQQVGNEWWIVDWKTGKFPNRPVQQSYLTQRWQHRLYPLALVLAGAQLVGEPLSPERIRMVYFYPEVGQELVFAYDPHQMHATIGRLTQLATDLVGPIENFPKKERDFCLKTGCSYISACYPDKRPEAKVQRPLPQFK